MRRQTGSGKRPSPVGRCGLKSDGVSIRWVWCGMLVVGIVAAALVSARGTYRLGIDRGRQVERERAFSKEGAIRVSPADLPPCQAPRARDAGHTNAAFADPAATNAPRLSVIWIDPLDCMRLIWPMELAMKSDTVDHPHIRIRQGANRFARPGLGVCEWAFETKQAAVIAIYLHCRARDECANSVFCRIDGSPVTFVEIPPPFGT